MSVDTARLRELLATEASARRARFETALAVETQPVCSGPEREKVLAARDAAMNASNDAVHATVEAAYAALPDLLDELDAARALLTEVAEHGLASFDPVRARVDLTRRIAAFLES